MTRRILVLCVAVTLTGCAEETRVISDRSAATKFTSLLGGKSAGGAWEVQQGGVQNQKPKSAATEMIGSTDNFSNLHFSTSFEQPDAAAHGPQNDAGAPVAPGMMTPWGAMPAAPGH